MKTILFTILSLSLFGCATRYDYMRSQEYQQRLAEQEEEEEEIWQAKMKARKKGSTIDTVKAAWGKPQRVENLDDVLSYEYENDGEPIIMFFKNRKLIGWKYDREQMRTIAAERAADRRHRADIRARQEAAAAQIIQQNMENTRKSFNTDSQSFNCTTNAYGSTAYTNCR